MNKDEDFFLPVENYGKSVNFTVFIVIYFSDNIY